MDNEQEQVRQRFCRILSHFDVAYANSEKGTHFIIAIKEIADPIKPVYLITEGQSFLAECFSQNSLLVDDPWYEYSLFHYCHNYTKPYDNMDAYWYFQVGGGFHTSETMYFRVEDLSTH